MAGRSQLPVQIMENQTRYDLNAAVENWRNELAAQPNLASDDRRELETHLRDAIAGFQQRGLNDEESFWLACRRIGQPQQLGEEFVKADSNAVWRERVFWMALACLIVSLWGSSLSLITNFAFFNPSTSIKSLETAIFYENCLRLVFFWLPILFCALMLVRGRLNFNQPKLITFFRSRFQLAVTTTLWALGNSSALLYHLPQAMKQHSYTAHASWTILLSNLLNTIIWPFLLIALVAWLMPTQNRKMLKRA
jgi:hypothetical protein